MLGQFSTLPSRRQAVGELVFAAGLWGIGFIAIRWGLETLGPLWLNVSRFALAALLSLPLLFASPALRSALSLEQFLLAARPGLLLGAMLILQTYGLKFTTVTRSSFITVLYILFVPVVERVGLGRRVPWLHVVWVLMALVGAGLICQVESGAWNLGDGLTLLCAACGALQIIELEVIGGRIRSSFVFSVFQAVWAGLLPLAVAPFLEGMPGGDFTVRSAGGILILAVGSTLIGFLIQIRSQQVLGPSLVSMLFLLESPFAAVFAYLIFSETLTLPQAIGAALILSAAAGTLRTHDNGPGPSP